jgi:RNA-directed DNA polymerase
MVKPGSTETRPLGIPTVRDRIVQAAIVNVIEPIFERDFAEQSYGFRPGRGCRDALRRVDALLQAGYTHVVDADLKGYFDSIPQGAVLSPLLSNVYLDPLDHLLARKGFQMVRYADDFVILCRTAADARRALEVVQAWVAENGLTLHPRKTRLVDAQSDGFDFLGYHFRGTRDGIRHWARQKSVRKLKATLRPKTKRSSGRSLQSVIAEVNRVLRGWFAYFQHSRPFVFALLDRWVRQRLRAILRKRRKRRGVAKGWDFHRWPNAFFAEQGLYSLVAAHASARQSSRR